MNSKLQDIMQSVSSNPEKFKFTEIDVKNFLGENYFNYHCEINSSGIKANGFGTAANKSKAFLSALGEAVERLCFYRQDKYRTTNGFAAHTDPEIAAESAKREIIERDTLLCHFHTGEMIRDITEYFRTGVGASRFLTNKIERAGKSIKIGLLHDKELFCVLAVIHPVIFGSVIGVSCKESLEEAVEKSILEAYINSNVSSTIPLTLDEFEALTLAESVKPLAHLRLGIGATISEVLLSQFDKGSLVKNIDLHLGSFEIETFDVQSVLEGLPFVVKKASNPYLQNLYFGRDVQNHLNFDRLTEFSSRPIRYLPHILG